MKRILILTLALLLALPMAACSDGSGDAANSPSGAPTPSAGSEYVLTYRDCPLPMNAEFGPLRAFLGEPDSYFEAASCAFDGLDKTFTYPGLEIITYPDEEKDNVDYISSVRLLDNTVSTPEGVTIGSTSAEVTAAYGEDYTAFGTQYSYENGDATLNFLFDGDSVISVEYIAHNPLLG